MPGLLRMPDREKAAKEMQRFEADLRAVKVFIDKRGEETRHSGRWLLSSRHVILVDSK